MCSCWPSLVFTVMVWVHTLPSAESELKVSTVVPSGSSKCEVLLVKLAFSPA